MNILSDIRFALRLLVKNPGSSAMAILVMAIGTGVAITMFAFVNGVLWSSLELKNDSELHLLQWTERDKARNNRNLNPMDYEVLKQESTSFDMMTAFRWGNMPFYRPGSDVYATKYEVVRVETDFFDLIGQKPILGRTFNAEDPSTNGGNIIISSKVWQDQFNQDSSAIGSVVMLNGTPRQIVGVMPSGFAFPDLVEIWIADDWQKEREAERKSGFRLWTIGFLKDGVTKAQAQVELSTIAKRLANEYPESNDNLTSMYLVNYLSWYPTFSGGDSFDTICYILLFCSILVLGVACANVFNLIMTRIATRTSELSVRSAMGARRSHIVAQVIIDGLILTGLGTVGGVLISGWSLKLLWAKFAQQKYVPYWWHMDMDGKVLGFVVAIVIGSALASSLIPGLRASRSSVAENLKDDSRTSSGLFIGTLSRIILGFQVTVTGVLAFVSVMMILVWGHMKSRTFGYEPETILNAQVNLVGGSKEKPELTARIQATHAAMTARMLEYPGVEAVAFATREGGSALPALGEIGNLLEFEVEGDDYGPDARRPQSMRITVSDGFDSVFGVEPLVGRRVGNADTLDTELVCMVNQSFVAHYWPNEDPIGKRIRYVGLGDDLSGEYLKVVGVMPNLLAKPMPGEDLVQKGYVKVYVPYTQTYGSGWLFYLLKTKGNPHEYDEILRRELQAVEPTQAFHGRMLTLKEMMGRDMVTMDLVFSMFGVFGFSSLVLGVVGLYAIMSFTTKQRFREFGIRMALGANSKEIMLSVVKRGTLLLVIGGVLGVSAGHAVSMILKSNIDVHELPLGYTYPIVIVILTLATVFSMGIPAWRASRISPTQALRVD